MTDNSSRRKAFTMITRGTGPTISRRALVAGFGTGALAFAASRYGMAAQTSGPAVLNPDRMSDAIYALGPRWVPNTLPPSDPPNFGNGHYTEDLFLYTHKGFRDGSRSWEDRRQIGNDWNFSEVFPGPHGVIYAIDGDGNLQWYQYRGRTGGTDRWRGPKLVGNGWNVRHVGPSSDDFLGAFCDTQNNDNALSLSSSKAIIYAVRANGELLWYRHDGAVDGSKTWANGGRLDPVGSGWVAGYRRVFSGCDGVIYLIGDDGTLYWYKHTGYLEGNGNWEARRQVGTGWHTFLNVFSIGEGIIYAIDTDGTLWWYKHNGYKTGASDWAPRRNVGNGWNGAGFSVVCNSVDLHPTIIH